MDSKAQSELTPRAEVEMSEADEIYKICSVIGSPTEETWLEGLNLATMFCHLSVPNRLLDKEGNSSISSNPSKRLPATLTNTTADNKPFNSYATPKAYASFGAGATQRMLDMANKINQDTTWNKKPVGSCHVRDAKYIPPGRKSPPSMNKNWVFTRGPSNKVANATVGGGKWSESQRQQQPAMKAGWVGQSGDMFLRPTQPPNPYSRKIAG